MAVVQTGAQELTLASGKKLTVPGPIRGVAVEHDAIIVRYDRPGESRQRIFGYDGEGVFRWNGQVYPFAQLHVDDRGRRVMLPGGETISLPAALASFVQVEPDVFVLVHDRNLGDPYNVVAYRSDGTVLWKIGDRDGRPPGPFGSAEIEENGALRAYSGMRGFAATVAQETGMILASEPYR